MIHRDIVFEHMDGIAVCRLSGDFPLQEGVRAVRYAIALAREQRESRLMIVITETTGYGVPTLSMRLGMMREFADAADGCVRVVLICRPELIDPNKFGVTMGANFGMQSEVFASEEEGLDWLRELP